MTRDRRTQVESHRAVQRELPTQGTPGKQTLTQMLPANGSTGSASSDAVPHVAEGGAAGARAALPQAPPIQGVFGRHGSSPSDTEVGGEAGAAAGDRGAAAASTGLPAAGDGKALPADVRAKMEEALGADFSAVRIHEGPQAEAMGALAYTQGTDIYFAPGQYQPETQRGQELLGHELTHVVQQSQGRVNTTTQAKGVGVNDDAGLESEADEMGARIARGGAGDAVTSAVVPRSDHHAAAQPIQRKASTTDDLAYATGGVPSFGALKALVDKIAARTNWGMFSEAEFKIGIPVPDAPGVFVTGEVSGNIFVDKHGKQKAKLDVTTGLELRIQFPLSLNVNVKTAVSLEGAHLGAAFVDSVKQSAYWILKQSGILARLKVILGLEKKDPSIMDQVIQLIPGWNTFEIAVKEFQKLGPEKLRKLQKALEKEFKNDPDVSFEMSMGRGCQVEGMLGPLGLAGKLEEPFGLEDVDGQHTKAFTESSGEVEGRLHRNSAKVKSTKRFREGGKSLDIFELQAALVIPGVGSAPSAGVKLIGNILFLESLIAVADSMYHDKQGHSADTAGPALALVQAVLNLSQLGAARLDRLWGVDLKVTVADGRLTVNDARIKSMARPLDFDEKATPYKAKVSAGVFAEVSHLLGPELAKRWNPSVSK